MLLPVHILRKGSARVAVAKFGFSVMLALFGYAHLNRCRVESNLSVPGIQGCHENALCKSFKTSLHLICLYASTNIPLGPA